MVFLQIGDFALLNFEKFSLFLLLDSGRVKSIDVLLLVTVQPLESDLCVVRFLQILLDLQLLLLVFLEDFEIFQFHFFIVLYDLDGALLCLLVLTQLPHQDLVVELVFLHCL